MKKVLVLLLVFASAVCMVACSRVVSITPDQMTAAETERSTTQSESEQTEAAVPTEDKPSFDPYVTENDYDPDPALFERQSGTDYGTLITDAEYYSTTAGDNKRFNILLPPGYDENGAYPVLYMIHGWGGSYAAHLYDGSYLHMLYGNLYRDGNAEPMMIVGVDMYTGKQDVKESLDGWQLREAYDRTVDDIAVDLLPYIRENFAVAEGRENTAVAGVSEGGAKSICTGFSWLDKIGYIGGFAPDGNVIPIGEYYSGSYWTIPYFDTLPQPTDDNMPLYLYLAVGSEDPYNIYSTGYYSEVFDGMGIRHQYDYVEGFGHDSGFWRVCMYNYLRKIFK